MQGVDQLLQISNTSFQEIGQARGAVFQELESVSLVSVLREHKNSDIRMLGPNQVSCLDTLQLCVGGILISDPGLCCAGVFDGTERRCPFEMHGFYDPATLQFVPSPSDRTIVLCR